MPSLQDLERAALDVLAILKGIKDFEEASIAVYGGLALWKYLPSGRTTEVIPPLQKGKNSRLTLWVAGRGLHHQPRWSSSAC